MLRIGDRVSLRRGFEAVMPRTDSRLILDMQLNADTGALEIQLGHGTTAWFPASWFKKEIKVSPGDVVMYVSRLPRDEEGNWAEDAGLQVGQLLRVRRQGDNGWIYFDGLDGRGANWQFPSMHFRVHSRAGAPEEVGEIPNPWLADVPIPRPAVIMDDFTAFIRGNNQVKKKPWGSSSLEPGYGITYS